MAPFIDHGGIHLDDEDDNNANGISGNVAGTEQWVTADRNTTYQIVRVK